MEDPQKHEQSHSDDMHVLTYLLQTVKGLSAVSTDGPSLTPDDDISFS